MPHTNNQLSRLAPARVNFLALQNVISRLSERNAIVYLNLAYYNLKTFVKLELLRFITDKISILKVSSYFG